MSNREMLSTFKRPTLVVCSIVGDHPAQLGHGDGYRGVCGALVVVFKARGGGEESTRV